MKNPSRLAVITFGIDSSMSIPLIFPIRPKQHPIVLELSTGILLMNDLGFKEAALLASLADKQNELKSVILATSHEVIPKSKFDESMYQAVLLFKTMFKKNVQGVYLPESGKPRWLQMTPKVVV